MKTTYVLAVRSFVEFLKTRDDKDAKELADGIQNVLSKKQADNVAYAKAAKRLDRIGKIPVDAVTILTDQEFTY